MLTEIVLLIIIKITFATQYNILFAYEREKFQKTKKKLFLKIHI